MLWCSGGIPFCQSPSLLSLPLFSRLLCYNTLEPKSYTNLTAECSFLGGDAIGQTFLNRRHTPIPQYSNNPQQSIWTCRHSSLLHNVTVLCKVVCCCFLKRSQSHKAAKRLFSINLASSESSLVSV